MKHEYIQYTCGNKKMDITGVVNSVIKNRTYPIVHDRISAQIQSMINFQMQDPVISNNEISELEEAELAESITNRYIESLAPRYDPVGVLTSQAVAEKMTQESLSSHRMAGVSTGASGFDRIREIANLKNKADIVRVITTPIRGVPRTRTMINELANTMVRITVKDITGESEIVNVRPPWYDTFMFLMNIPPQSMSPRWIRLYLKEDSMYRYRVSMPVLYSVVSSNIEKSTIALLYPPAGATDRLYVDIHVGPLPDDDNNPLYLAERSVKAQIVGGVPTVSSAAPVGVNLLKDLEIVPYGDGVFEIRAKVPEFVPPSAWSHMIKMMVPEVEILSPTGRKFRSALPEFHDRERIRHIILEIPTNYESLVDRMVIDEGVHIIFKKNMIDEYPFLEHVIMDDRSFTSEEDARNFLLVNIAEFATYWYIECICPRAQDLYSLAEVDSTRTYTTSSLNCMESLGYLAMRNMIYEGFKSNINVSPILVGLIIDNITLYRAPVSFKRQSIANDKSEFLTSTTFEHVSKYITYSAFAGETDHMQSVSAHVLTGSPIEIGRGGSRLGEENTYVKARREARKK